jgi:hypothetical protein
VAVFSRVGERGGVLVGEGGVEVKVRGGALTGSALEAAGWKGVGVGEAWGLEVTSIRAGGSV